MSKPKSSHPWRKSVKNLEKLNRAETIAACSKHDMKNRMKKYGLTPKDYDVMYEKQKGCCDICRRHQSEFKNRLAVDHDHETGKIRGLLCMVCNTHLGFYETHKNEVQLYLTKHET